MPRLPPAVIGDAYTSSVPWDLLEDLVDVGNRMAGQSGEAEAAELVGGGSPGRPLGGRELKVGGRWPEEW